MTNVYQKIKMKVSFIIFLDPYYANERWPTQYVKVLCCIIMLTYSQVTTQDPVAVLPQGRIVGIKVYGEGSLEPVEIFLGVPYAVPPVGRHRFSAPERHSGWRRTFFAHRMPPHCPQVGDSENGNHNEDCLFLNIWTTRRADGKSQPVVVIFYSESWLDGGVTLPCQELAAEGVVVVTVAYRLHLLAFFTLGSVSARGNLALLDQYMALLWVRDNIAAFGGDPTIITLAGYSAGADSVLYHISSPRSTGLFQRAIIMSPQNPWKIIDEKTSINATTAEALSREIARSIGCIGNSDQEILHCLRARPLSDFINIYSNANWSKGLEPIPDNFLPEVEQYLPASLPIALSATKHSMQLDLLLGATDLEAMNYNDDNYNQLKELGGTRVSEFATTNAIPNILKIFSLYRSETISMLTQAIRWEYWGAMTKKDIENNPGLAIEKLARMESSAFWGAGNALLAARLARRVSRLYVYRYSQPTNVDLRGRQINCTGAVHGSDLLALLGDSLMLQVARRRASAEEKQISSLFRRYITQFIKYGTPGTDDEWKRYKVGDAQIRDIRVNNDYIRVYNANKHVSNRDISFWLQYLPQLSNLNSPSGYTEQLTSERDEGRLRGGVYGMCGLSAVLLMLLGACVVLLRKERGRHSCADNVHN